MNKIEMGKKYRTRDGREARVLCTDRKDDKHPVVAMIGNSAPPRTEQVVTLSATGGYISDGRPSEIDLIEVSPYEHLKIDDLVVVWDDSICRTATMLRRHFAGINELGRPTTWLNGRTSHTASSVTAWGNCIAFDAGIHAHIGKGD